MVLADFFGTDDISFSLTSDDLPGVTHSFTSFSDAAAEAGNSVVWGGIHFRFDVDMGQALGQSVAGFVDQSFFQPLPARAHRHPGLPSELSALDADMDHRLDGRSAEHQADTGHAQGLAPRDRPAVSSTSESSGTRSTVAAGVSGHLGAASAHHAAALDAAGALDADPLG
jgi:hypothetical protein